MFISPRASEYPGMHYIHFETAVSSDLLSLSFCVNLNLVCIKKYQVVVVVMAEQQKSQDKP
jgi:hypothetical protein